MPELPDWFRPVAEYMLREGLPETLRLAALAVSASLVVGVLLGTLMTIKFRPVQWLIRLFIEVWRGLPILVTVLFIYWLPNYHVGPFHIQLNAYMSAAVALSLWGSAQVAEATRGAVQSIPKEQHEAASALGFGWIGRHAFVIGVNEFLQSGNRQFENLTTQTGNGHPFTIFGFVLVVFFVISFPLTRLAAFLERRLV